MLRKTFKDLTHPEDLTASLDKFFLLVEGKFVSYSEEKRLIRKDGSLVWINVSVSLQRDAGESQFIRSGSSRTSPNENVWPRICGRRAEFHDPHLRNRINSLIHRFRNKPFRGSLRATKRHFHVSHRICAKQVASNTFVRVFQPRRTFCESGGFAFPSLGGFGHRKESFKKGLSRVTAKFLVDWPGRATRRVTSGGRGDYSLCVCRGDAPFERWRRDPHMTR